MTYRIKCLRRGIAAFAIFSSASVSAAETDPETGINEFLREYERAVIAATPSFDGLPEPTVSATIDGCILAVQRQFWHPTEAVFYESMYKSLASMEEPPEDQLERLFNKIEALRKNPVPVRNTSDERFDLAKFDFAGGLAIPAPKGSVGWMFAWPDVNRADTKTNMRAMEVFTNYVGSPEGVEKMKRDGQKSRLKLTLSLVFPSPQETNREREDRLRAWDHRRYVFINASRQLLAFDDATDISVSMTYRGEEPFEDDDIVMGRIVQPNALMLGAADESGLNLQTERLVIYQNHVCPDGGD